MTKLIRGNIPVLNMQEVKIGTAKTVNTSFPEGKRNFFRRNQYETLELNVEFENEWKGPLVVLSTDINNNWGEWQDIVFERVGSKIFSLKIPLHKCGVFRFKVKYSPDSGEKCFWTKGAYSYLLVDPQAVQNVRMYSLIPTVSGHIGNWIEELERIKAMNFDMVHCLPLTAMDVSESPYSAHDLFSIDPSYVDPASDKDGLQQLEEFVKKARALGLRLCFDLVVNHLGATSKIARNRPDWIVQDKSRADGLKRAGCWHCNDWISWEDLVLIDYDHPVASVRKEIFDYMKQYMMFWANYASHTGGMIRYDNLHSSHNVFIQEATHAIQDRFPGLMVLAEFFTSEEVFIERVPEWSLNLLQGNPWEYPFAEDLRNYLRRLHEVKDRLKYMFSLTTHDTETPAQRFGGAESTIPRYFVCALFSTGKTGLVQGVEYGQPQKIEFIGRQPCLEFDKTVDYSEFIASVNRLLGEYPVLQRGGNLRFVDEEHGAVMGAYRYSETGDEDEFLLFANMDISNPYEVWFDMDGNGITFKRLEDVLEGKDNREYTGSHLPLNLEPGQVKAFKLIKN